MRVPWLATGLVCALFLTASESRSDTSSAPGSAAFNGMNVGTPDPGPASALWEGSNLSAAEQAYVARASNTTGFAAVNAAYAAASADAVAAAQANAATLQLDVEDLADEGVVR